MAFTMCKLVVCVDGTHLRGEYKGKLLIAVTQDVNNQILPLTYALVNEETIKSWDWFMYQLHYHVLKDRYAVYVISDRHQGIIRAMSTHDYWMEPVAFHRFCLRHVRSNLMTRHKGLHLKRLCWTLGNARQMHKWRGLKREMQLKFPDAWAYLSKIEEEK